MILLVTSKCLATKTVNQLVTVPRGVSGLRLDFLQQYKKKRSRNQGLDGVPPTAPPLHLHEGLVRWPPFPRVPGPSGQNRVALACRHQHAASCNGNHWRRAPAGRRFRVLTLLI